jgi:hypothetical protein
MSKHMVEYIGGPKDGEEHVWHGDSVPLQIVIAGLPEDHYARMMSAIEIDITEAPTLLEGFYTLDRYDWTMACPDGTVTKGLYTWQGYQ